MYRFGDRLSVGQVALKIVRSSSFSVRRGSPKKALNRFCVYVFVRLFLPPVAVVFLRSAAVLWFYSSVVIKL